MQIPIDGCLQRQPETELQCDLFKITTINFDLNYMVDEEEQNPAV